ncbi:MAG: M20/M25/M40 family metallo-hydrolase [Anaerocolumna sp.]
MINRDRLVNEFFKLVAIDSVSFKERKMADVLKAYLKELGFTVYEDDAGEIYHGNAGNVYGYLPGELEGEPILLSAHMDTVEPGLSKRAVLQEDGRITSEGNTILGADDLSGVVSILEAIRSIREQGIKHRSIEVLFPIAEEVYIRGSEVFDYSRIKAKEAYVLDLSGPIGTAAIQAPTLVSFTAKFIGKAAHAGFAPETGIHAISMAAQAITSIKQGRINHETTVNIGTIEGGLAKNIIPKHCIISGEVRCLDHEGALRHMEEIKEAIYKAAAEYMGRVEVETSFGCIAYDIDRNHRVVRRYEKACVELDIPVNFVKTFGGSDNNNFVKNGIKGIVIACGMNEVHSTNEYTHVEDLEKCSKIVYKLLTRSY